jgi:hypothetical protein
MQIKNPTVKMFNRLHEALAKRYPDEIASAKALGRNAVEAANGSAEECWRLIWPKPLYANSTVEIAEEKIGALYPFMDAAWRHLGKANSDWRVSRISSGAGLKSFVIRGARASRARVQARVAPHRMFAIQGGAQALRHRAGGSSTAPYVDCVHVPKHILLPRIQQEMGAFWGPTTVLHFLTDLGLGCKPDRHLVRAIRCIGLGEGLSGQAVPGRREAIEITARVAQLVEVLHGRVTPALFRETDKLLMEFSRKELLPGRTDAVRRRAVGDCVG